MLIKCILLVLLGATLAMGQKSFPGVCKQTFGTNKYDLEGGNNPKIDYITKDTSGNTYYFQPCMFTVFGCANDMGSGTPYLTNFCQVDATKPVGNNHSLGNWLVNGQMAELSPGGGVSVNFTGGDNGRQASILCQCLKTASTPTFTFSNENTGAKLYTVIFVSKSCCPGGGGKPSGKKKI